MPLTFRTAILPGLNAIDAIVGALDLAPFQVTIVTRHASGGEAGTGVKLSSTISLPNWTMVKTIAEREVAASAGRYRMGDMRVGPIRPQFTNPITGIIQGFTLAQLDPTQKDDSAEVIYRMTETSSAGTGEAGDYTLVDLERDNPLEFYAVVRRRFGPAAEPLPGET